MRTIEWTLRARSEIIALDHQIAQRIYNAMKRYAASGSGDVKQLHGMINRYRLRVGDWRVVFSLEEGGRPAHPANCSSKRHLSLEK